MANEGGGPPSWGRVRPEEIISYQFNVCFDIFAIIDILQGILIKKLAF